MPDRKLTRILLDAPTEGNLTKVPLAKLGDDYDDPRYGSFGISSDEVAGWKASIARAPGRKVLLDFDHLSSKPSPHRRTKAAGWITDVNVDDDGQVWADVEPTPAGREAIKNKEYLFASATYGDAVNEKGEKFPNSLVAAALTNSPFLKDMPQISLAADDVVQRALEDDMRTLSSGVTQAERDQAHAEGNALPDKSYPIRNVEQLKAAILLAQSGHGDVAAAKKLIVRRARALGHANLIPADWLASPTDGRPVNLLEQAPETLGDDHQALDLVLRCLSRETGSSYVDALAAWQTAERAEHEHFKTAPATVATVLRRTGVRDLDSFAGDLKLLERRDAAVLKTLEGAQTQLAGQRLNGQAQVLLDDGFDVAELLHNDLELERRWRRARKVAGGYEDRARWHADDLLHLESGVDLCATLERGPQVAAAHEQVTATIRELDAALDANVEPRKRAKQLDAALTAMTSERERVSVSDPFDPDAKPAPTVRELEQGERPERISDLSIPGIERATQLLLEGHSYDDAIQLAAGFAVAGGGFGGRVGPGPREAILKATPDAEIPATAPGPHDELNEQVLEYQKAHPGTPYTDAFSAVSGVSLGAGNFH
jgi:Mu-like prophage I protein